MVTKQTFRQIFWIFLLALLVACGERILILPTATAIPIVVSPTMIPTFILPPVTILATPLPTLPVTPPFITPDAIQTARWKEYEAILAKSLGFLPQETLCEWDILGTSEQILYIWVVCENTIPFGTTSKGIKMYSSSSTPALIHIEKDRSVHSVEIPAPGISDYKRMFPTYVQEKFEFYRFGRAKELSNHIEWRRTHPEEPPLIVLGATSTP